MTMDGLLCTHTQPTNCTPDATTMAPNTSLKRKAMADAPIDAVTKRTCHDTHALLLLKVLDIDIENIPPKTDGDHWNASMRADAQYMRAFIRDPDLTVKVRMTHMANAATGITMDRVRVYVRWGHGNAKRALTITLFWRSPTQMFAEMHVPNINARRLAWHPDTPYVQGYARRWACICGKLPRRDAALAEIVMFNFDGARMIQSYHSLREQFPDHFLAPTCDHDRDAT